MYGENDMKWGEKGEMYGEIERMGYRGTIDSGTLSRGHPCPAVRVTV